MTINDIMSRMYLNHIAYGIRINDIRHRDDCIKSFNKTNIKICRKECLKKKESNVRKRRKQE